MRSLAPGETWLGKHRSTYHSTGAHKFKQQDIKNYTHFWYPLISLLWGLSFKWRVANKIFITQHTKAPQINLKLSQHWRLSRFPTSWLVASTNPTSTLLPFHHAVCFQPILVVGSRGFHRGQCDGRKGRVQTNQNLLSSSHPAKCSHSNVLAFAHNCLIVYYTLRLTRRFSGLISRWMTFLEWQ